MGIVVNDGIRRPTVRIDELQFATKTPFETRLQHETEAGQRVMPAEVAQVTRRALLRVVNSGTARRIKDTYRDNAARHAACPAPSSCPTARRSPSAAKPAPATTASSSAVARRAVSP